MIFVGIVLIPAQTGAVYAQLTARRQTIGPTPARGEHAVLVSTRLSDVRGFSDFLMEIFSAAARGGLPRTTRMVVLGGRAPFEFRALQELNDRRLTLVEGSALSERDLTRVRAEAAAAVLLLADRFSPDPDAEDVSVLFQCWAVKSYVKRVPVYVQVLRRASLQAVRPFLDPARDVAVSVEQTRHRLLALSALCPGASTLLANLLRRSAISPAASLRSDAAGRRWLRAYMNGCGEAVHAVPLSRTYACVPFATAAAALHAAHGVALAGVLVGGRCLLNPGRRLLRGGETAVVVASGAARAARAAAAPYAPLPSDAAAAALAGALATPVTPPPPSPCTVGDVESESVDFEPEECAIDGRGVSTPTPTPTPAAVDAATVLTLAAADPDRLPPMAAAVAAEAAGDEAPTFTMRVAPPPPPSPADDAARVAACAVGPDGFVDDSDYFGGRDRRDVGVFGGVEEADGKKKTATAPAAGDTDATTSPPSPSSPPPDRDDLPLTDASGAPLTGHIIVTGAPASLLPFVEQLRACDPVASPLVVLAPTRPPDWGAVTSLGPAFYVRGDPSATAGLRAARAAGARALVYLALPLRPGGPTPASTSPPPPATLFSGGSAAVTDRADASRTAVLADAPGLLCVYGVGEEGGVTPAPRRRGTLFHLLPEVPPTRPPPQGRHHRPRPHGRPRPPPQIVASSPRAGGCSPEGRPGCLAGQPLLLCRARHRARHHGHVRLPRLLWGGPAVRVDGRVGGRRRPPGRRRAALGARPPRPRRRPLRRPRRPPRPAPPPGPARPLPPQIGERDVAAQLCGDQPAAAHAARARRPRVCATGEGGGVVERVGVGLRCEFVCVFCCLFVQTLVFRCVVRFLGRKEREKGAVERDRKTHSPASLFVLAGGTTGGAPHTRVLVKTPRLVTHTHRRRPTPRGGE